LKKLSLILLALLVVTAGQYAFSAESAVMETTCTINRSIEMLVIVKYVDKIGYQVTLQEKFWNSAETRTVKVMNRVSFVQYGQTKMIMADLGRSGYAFLRIEENGKALVDLNIFGVGYPFFTDGKLFETWCH
jgi:hypothetical protein